MGQDKKNLKKTHTEWVENVEKGKAKRPERKEEFDTISGIPVKGLYSPLDLESDDYTEELGFPGEYPFTRGVQPTMYRGRLWTMRQYAGFATAEESNKRYKYLLDQGQTGLSVAFDLPSQIGYDSDHALAEGEVGKVGVAIDTLEDVESLFSEIPLDKVSTSMTINAPASILLAMYIVVAEQQGVSPDKLRGTIQNDILKEYTARGTYIFPPKQSMRIITDIFEYCSQNVPQWNTISISGYHIREAGATAVQEVAFTIANAIAYAEAAIKAGLDIDTFGPRLSFFFISQQDFFEEVAKFRAARRLWARIMKDRFKAKNPKSMQMRFHIQTAGSTLTAQQPINNIVRVAFQGMSAVLGGTQSLHTCSMDEALALPSEEAVQTSLRTQQIIAYESGIPDTVDPLAGSYYVESLTDEIESGVLEYIKKIDEMGGAPGAIENGYIQKELQDSAYRYQKEVESAERVIVGVNKFQIEEEEPTNLLRVNPAVRKKQVEKLEIIKGKRNKEKVKNELDALKKGAQADSNLMPLIINCVRERATLGEICNELRDVFGEYRVPFVI